MNASELKIVLVGPSWPFRSGIARYTTWLAESLHERGLLAGFFTPTGQYPQFLFPGRSDQDADVCERLPYAKPCYDFSKPWTWPGLVRRVRAASCNLIVTPYWMWGGVPFCVYLARKCSLPVVLIVHNTADHESASWKIPFRNAALTTANGFFCHSLSTYQFLCEKQPSKRTRHHPLVDKKPCSIELSPDGERLKFGISRNEIAVLFFGIIRPYKGMDVLLKALKLLPQNSPIRILIVGEPWTKKHRRDVKEAVETQRVIAKLEWVSEQERRKWLSIVDAAIFPYRQSYGSAALAEAVQCGLPIVASRLEAFCEWVVDGENGILVPPDRACDLAKGLEKLSQPGVLAKLKAGAAARRNAHRFSSWIDEFVELAKEVRESR